VARSTKQQLAKRIEEVLHIMLLGGELHDLREHARGQKWNVCDGTLYRYMQEALSECQKRVEKDRDKLIARHLMQRRSLYARAMEANDLRTALAVVKDEAELYGLYPAAKVEHEHGGKLAIVEEIIDGDADSHKNNPAAPGPKPVPKK
jgi:hypothetical protein